MQLKFRNITDPPDMVSGPVGRIIFPVHFAAGNLLAERDGFQDGTVGEAAASNVVHFAGAWRLGKAIKGANQVSGVHIVADLLAFITKDLVPGPTQIAP